MIAAGAVARAHKPVTSKYSYTTDVYPIFRDRCGACHQPDGVGPMSLLTYQDARPWAQSIKDEVINLRMPPRYAEKAFGSVRNGHGLNAREIDTIIEWANGGTPEGPRVQTAPAAGAAEAAATTPDLLLDLPEVTLAKDVGDDTKTFTVATGLTADRFVRRLDVVPGAPSIVRSVVISTSGSVLAAWQPGQEALRADRDEGYKLPAKTTLSVRVRYKKTWKQEGQAVTDRTSLNLWLTTKRPANAIERLAVANAAGESLKRAVRLVAVVPRIETTLDSVRIEAVKPDGTRQKLLLLTHPSPDWPARYLFDAPIALPAGSKIEIVSTPPPPNPAGRVALQLEYTQPRQ